MAKLQYVILAVTLATAYTLLLMPSEIDAAIVQLAEIKCVIFVNFTDQFSMAHGECYKKLREENKGKDKDYEKKERIPYPYNATIEDFEWDDHCVKHCIYKTVGLLSDDDTLPKKTDTAAIFGKRKISDESYKVITSAWDDCLVMSEEIGKKKGWDNCKIVTHHNFCFEKKYEDVLRNMEVDC